MSDKNDARIYAILAQYFRDCGKEEKAKQIEHMTSKLWKEADWKARKLQAPSHAAEFDCGMRVIGSGLVGMTRVEQMVESLACEFGNTREKAGAMMFALTQGCRPTYLRRQDWGLHFIFGAWIEATMGMGREAGEIKELLDKWFGTGQCDQGDLDATVAGAKWARANEH